MTERQQLRQVCGWNRQLAGENRSLRAELCRAKTEVEKLNIANANLWVERDAADALLGAAMDEALRASKA
jgi:hypothetical protein